MKIYTKRATKETLLVWWKENLQRRFAYWSIWYGWWTQHLCWGFAWCLWREWNQNRITNHPRVFFLIWVRCLLQTPDQDFQLPGIQQNTSKFWKNLWIKWMNSCRCFAISSFLLGTPQYLQLTCAGPFAGGWTKDCKLVAFGQNWWGQRDLPQ